MESNKNLFVLSLISLVLAISLSLSVTGLGLVSSAVVQPSTVSHDSGSFVVTFNLSNTGSNTSVSFSTSSMSSGSATISVPSVQINTGEEKVITATISYTKYQSGIFSGNIRALHSNGDNATVSFSVPISSSANLAFSKERDFSLTQNATVKLTNEGNVPLTVSLNASGSFEVVLTSSTVSLTPGSSQTITLSPKSSFSESGLTFGSYNTLLTATDSANSISQSLTIPFFKYFCSMGAIGRNLTITDFDLSNIDGDEDNEWRVLDEIEITLELENVADEDVDDVIVELALFDSSGRNVAKNNLIYDNSDENKLELGNLPDGDSDTAKFVFKVDPKMDTGKYQLAIKAYGDELGEENMCDDSFSGFSKTFYEEITVRGETDEGKLIKFDEFIFNQNEYTCGSDVALSFDAINVGSSKQKQVKVDLISTELGISQSFIIRDDMSEGDSERVNFNFVIPSTAQQKNYILSATASYDYDSVKDLYRETLDKSEELTLKVLGCGGVTNNPGQSFVISANLASTAKAGEDLIVVATIQNVQNKATDVVVGVNGYDSWAELSNSSSRLLSLGAGESKQVTFNFKVNKDSSGEQSFMIETLSNGKTESREVAVNLGANSSWLSSNWLIWVIVAVNVLLILLIIFVAVRLSSR